MARCDPGRRRRSEAVGADYGRQSPGTAAHDRPVRSRGSPASRRDRKGRRKCRRCFFESRLGRAGGETCEPAQASTQEKALTLTIHPVAGFSGEILPPGDKSLTHRAYMFAAIARGESRVKRPLRAEDCDATLRCLNELGLRHEWVSPEEIRLIPTSHWLTPRQPLDCGNSGTTMRLLSGLIAS